jgi:uncharacterized integral membrane protein
MSLLLVILCLLFFGAMLLVVTLNGSPVDVHLYFRSYSQVPLSLVMVVSMLAGILFTALLGVLDGIRIRIHNRRLRRQVSRLERQIQGLHTPVAPADDGPAPFGPPPDYPPP